MDSGEVKRETLTRGQVSEFFAQPPAGLVAMEACGSAHQWGRVLQALKFMVYAGERPIALFAWSSAPRHLAPRDRYIGWAQDLRKQNIRYVAYNTRYLILPWVRVPHLGFAPVVANDGNTQCRVGEGLRV